LERTPAFLRKLRAKRLARVINGATLSNPDFQERYAKQVVAAQEAAAKGDPLPEKHSNLYEPRWDDWRSGDTVKGRNFRKRVEHDINMAMDVLRETESRLPFEAPRNDWVQYLHDKYQILASSLISASQKDTRLLIFSIVLRWYGFFYLEFMANVANIGIVQDIAHHVGCKSSASMFLYPLIHLISHIGFPNDR